MMKLIGMALAGGLLLVGCAHENKDYNTAQNGNPPGMVEVPPAQPQEGQGGGSSIGTGMGNQAGSSTGPTGSGGSNSEQQRSNQSSPMRSTGSEMPPPPPVSPPAP